MTKRELIEALAKYDDDIDVYIDQEGVHTLVFGVSEQEDNDGEYLVII